MKRTSYIEPLIGLNTLYNEEVPWIKNTELKNDGTGRGFYTRPSTRARDNLPCAPAISISRQLRQSNDTPSRARARTRINFPKKKQSAQVEE